MRDIEGLTAITNVEGGVSAFDMEDALSEGRAMVIGAREGVLMLRAHDAAQYKVNAPHLMISGEKERLAARRLEARGLLRRHFPGAGPGHSLRRYFTLTDKGAQMWLLVRGEL